jgi:hypothetical protein
VRAAAVLASAALVGWLGSAAPGVADEAGTAQPPAANAGTAAASGQEPAEDEALEVDPAEPDFDVVTLPTNLRLPRHKLAFRLTHRFDRDLGAGDFADLLADLFGFDAASQVGLGLRFGLFRGTRLGIYRTNQDKTIELHAQQELLRDGEAPLGLSIRAGVEGVNNFGLTDTATEPLHEFSPSVAVVLSKKLGGRGALYVVPSWVGNTRINPSAPGDDDGTIVLGLGARLLVVGSMSVVAEYHPRLAGYEGNLGSGDPDSLATFGLEWRVGGHAFQLNVSNTLGTTPAQVARGAQGADGWFIGFNLTRKFY